MGLKRKSHLTRCLLLLLFLLLGPSRAVTQLDRNNLPDGVSVEQVLALHKSRVTMRLEPRFRFAGARWPPEAVTLLAVKDTRSLELWARSDDEWVHIRDYQIKAMSGRLGPKLKEGDLQVPEGFYRIDKLNPNSAYHLSLKIDYPNLFDREKARLDGRTKLGGDIYIHGKNVSQGCLAVGDKAIEELFVLVALLGKEHVSVVISPHDFRSRPWLPAASEYPVWVRELHEAIATDFKRFPLGNKESVE